MENNFNKNIIISYKKKWIFEFVSFKFSKATNSNLDVTNAATWATAGPISNQLRTSSGDYPGFYEDVTALNITYSQGDLLAFTASSSTGFSNTGEDVEVTLILEGVDS